MHCCSPLLPLCRPRAGRGAECGASPPPRPDATCTTPANGGVESSLVRACIACTHCRHLRTSKGAEDCRSRP
eukprot:361791-Chlamydomonas_euryale.AAC.19